MAQGDFTVFDDAILDLGRKVHNIHSGGDALKLGFCTGALPAENVAGPHFNGTGTTNVGANETNGGNVPAGGWDITGQSFANSAGVQVYDNNNVVIPQNAANPSAPTHCILYNSTDANKRAIGVLDLGGAKDLSAGQFTWAPAATGVFRIGVGTITE